MPIPLVSIVVPSFNQGQFIESTLRSVFEQNYPEIECIVIDGGSTDNTLDVLRKYDDRLTWVSEPDDGQADAINKGFRMARGEIVAWLNSDDVYKDGAVKKVVETMGQNPEVMLVYGNGDIIDEEGGVIRPYPHHEPFDLWRLINVFDFILQPSTFIRRAVFDTMDMVDASLHYCMDWDLWIRIAKRFPVLSVPDKLACSREYPGAKTFKGHFERQREINRVIKKYSEKRYPLARITYTIDTYEKYLSQKFPNAYRLFFSRIICRLQNIYYTRIPYEGGTYPDGWAGSRLNRILINDGKKKLHINGRNKLGEVADNFDFTMKVQVDGTVIEAFEINEAGPFNLSADIPEQLVDRKTLNIEICSTSHPGADKTPTDEKGNAYYYILESISLQ